MTAPFKQILHAGLAGLLAAACWRSAAVGADDDTETEDTLGGITDPDTGGPWVYEWSAAAPVAADLSDVHGFSPTDVFAVGDDCTILHYDGTAWEQMPCPAGAPAADLAAVWGAAPDDVYAVGADGAIFHYDGAAWSAAASPTAASLHDVCGRAADEVFAVGDGGVIAFLSGAAWSVLETGFAQNLFAAYCEPGAAVYVAGHQSDAFASGLLLRYEGDVSAVDAYEIDADYLYALGGRAPGPVFLGGGYEDGDGGPHFELQTFSPGDGFAVVASGDALLVDLAAGGAGAVWAAGRSTADGTEGCAFLQRLGAEAPEAGVFCGIEILRGVWTDPAVEHGDVFAVGDGGAIVVGVAAQAY